MTANVPVARPAIPAYGHATRSGVDAPSPGLTSNDHARIAMAFNVPIDGARFAQGGSK